MFIYVTIDRDDAIRAGREQYGQQLVSVSLESLSPDQRDEITRLPLHHAEPHRSLPDLRPAYMSEAKAHYSEYVGYTTRIVEPTQDAIARALDERRARRIAHEAAKEAERARLSAEALDAYRNSVTEYVSLPVDQRARRATPHGGAVERHCSPDVLVSLKEAIAAAEAEADAYTIETEAAKAAERQAATAARDARASADLADLEAWLDANLSGLAKRRYSAGLMPVSEIDGILRDNLFAPLVSFGRYERLTKEDWPYDLDCDTSLEFVVGRASGCTDAQYERMEAIRAAAPKDSKIELRAHVLQRESRDDDDEDEVMRLSVHVTASIFGRTYTREYAV